MSGSNSIEKGPKLNSRVGKPTERDNLGITSIQASMQDELCPVVTTVTYRAFYWAFLVWNYYDYLKRHSVKEISGKDAWGSFNNNCVKKNDFYFILGCMLNDNAERQNLAGVENGEETLKNDGPYSYNNKYLQAFFGGMQYYAGGVQTLGFVTDREQDDTPIPGISRITESVGKPLGEAFDKAISKTKYYKNYKDTDTPVPREVLKELGESIRLDMYGLDECKQLLRDAIFGEHDNKYYSSKNIIQSRDYLMFLYNEYDLKEKPSTGKLREILYDWFSPRGEHRFSYPEELECAVKGWESIIGRQYFTTSIEIICRAMKANLEYPKTLGEILRDTVNNTNWKDMQATMRISEIVESCNYNYGIREKNDV